MGRVDHPPAPTYLPKRVVEQEPAVHVHDLNVEVRPTFVETTDPLIAVVGTDVHAAHRGDAGAAELEDRDGDFGFHGAGRTLHAQENVVVLWESELLCQSVHAGPARIVGNAHHLDPENLRHQCLGDDLQTGVRQALHELRVILDDVPHPTTEQRVDGSSTPTAVGFQNADLLSDVLDGSRVVRTPLGGWGGNPSSTPIGLAAVGAEHPVHEPLVEIQLRLSEQLAHRPLCRVVADCESL